MSKQKNTYLSISILLFITNIHALEFLGEINDERTIQKDIQEYKAIKSEENNVFNKTRQRSMRGDGLAMISLARMYELGMNTEQNDKQAFYYYSQAADLGYDRAQLKTAEFYEKGIGTDKNQNRAIELYKKLADKGNMEGQYNTGRVYTQSARTFEEGLDYILKSANQNFEPAQYLLAQIYHLGNSKFRDLKKASEWYEQSALQGNADAQYNLATFYLNGKGVEKSLEQAVNWFGKSAENGNVKAQYSLGLRYLLGQGVAKDLEKAAKWFLVSAKKDNPFAQYSIALRYALGQGVKKDEVEKVFWLEKAANQNHQQAQYSLGMHYFNSDKEKAKKYLKQAANLGNKEAQKRLKELEESIYKLNKIVTREEQIKEEPFRGQQNNRYIAAEPSFKKELDYTEENKDIVSFIAKRADKGDIKAQYNLGIIYFKGELVPYDVKKALYWMERAAAAGNADALNNMTLIYLSGEYVNANIQRSYIYAKRSAKLGNERGKELLKFIENKYKTEK